MYAAIWEILPFTKLTLSILPLLNLYLIILINKIFFIKKVGIVCI